MLVVSNIGLTTQIPVMKPSAFFESTIKDFTLNLNTDYRYLKTGYYVSVHAEVLGNSVIPSSENIIDSSRTPVLLLRAARAGIPTLPFIVTDSIKKIMSKLDFPIVVFPINPFIYQGFKIASNKSGLYRAVKSLGMNYKFPVCALPLIGEMRSVRSIFGKCELDLESEEVAKRVFDLFKIPICRLHMQRVEEKVFLCGLQPLIKEELSPRDLKTISIGVSLVSKQGEFFSG